MDVTKYLTLQELAYEDKELRMPSSFGFVLHPDGRIFHLMRQFCHGAVIALLEQEEAIGAGIGLPEREYFSVYDYQDFMFAVSDRLGYITVGLGIVDRVSYSNSQKITKEQVDSLKKYFYNVDMLDAKFDTSLGSCTGRKVVSNLDEQHNHMKANGVFIPKDLEEPEEDF